MTQAIVQSSVTFDTQATLVKFDPLKLELTALVVGIPAMTVVDQPSSEVALRHAIQLKALVKSIEEIRVNAVEPYKEFTSAVDKYARELKALLDPAQKHLNTQLGNWNTREAERKLAEARRLEAEKQAKIQQLADEAADRKKAMEDFGVATTKADDQAAVAEQKAVAKTYTAEVRSLGVPAVKGVRQQWKHELIDLSLVPRDYLMVNDQAVREAINAGAREIPGLRIYAEANVAIPSRAAT